MESKKQSLKKVLYVDMDNVLVDFPSAFSKIDKEIFEKYKDKDDIPGIFALMDPIVGAIDAFKILSEKFDVYILSTAPWENPSAWSNKLEWVKKYLGDNAYKRLILTHHKNLNKGDYLIDDREVRGALEFNGEFIHFGSEKFPNWDKIINYLNFSVKTDLENIFLGVINNDNGYDVKVYIINIFEEPKKIQLLQGSFQGNEDELLDLGHSPYKELLIPANGYLQIDHMKDPGELDFTTYYNIKVDGVEYLEQINGWCFSEDKLISIPTLNEKGYLFGFSKVSKSSK